MTVTRHRTTPRPALSPVARRSLRRPAAAAHACRRVRLELRVARRAPSSASSAPSASSRDAFTLDAALDICCEPDAEELAALELLAALVDASLVVVDSTGSGHPIPPAGNDARLRARETRGARRTGSARGAPSRVLSRTRGGDRPRARPRGRAGRVTWALAGGDVVRRRRIDRDDRRPMGETRHRDRRRVAVSRVHRGGRPTNVRRCRPGSGPRSPSCKVTALRLDDSLFAARNAVAFARAAGDEASCRNALRSLSIFAAWSDRFDESRGALEEAIAARRPRAVAPTYAAAARGARSPRTHVGQPMPTRSRPSSKRAPPPERSATTIARSARPSTSPKPSTSAATRSAPPR